VVRSRHRHLRGEDRDAGRESRRGDGVDLGWAVNPVPPPDRDRHPRTGRLPRSGPARLARPLSRRGGAAIGPYARGARARAGRSRQGGRGTGGSRTGRRSGTAARRARYGAWCHRSPTISVGHRASASPSPPACPRQSCLGGRPRRRCLWCRPCRSCVRHPFGRLVRTTRAPGTSAAARFRGRGVRTPAVQRSTAPHPGGGVVGRIPLGGRSRSGGRSDGLGRPAVG